MSIPKQRPLRVCFSYAAYAKNLIRHLQSMNIPVETGLAESEFAALESSLNFLFPPDLRYILKEGLPVGLGFPNWRSSSKQQLEILINLPILEICKEVSRNLFWVESWGHRPDDVIRAVELARLHLKRAPILVPIYRDFYIPAETCMTGNPVFYVHGGDVRLWSFDIAGFFQQYEFREMNGGDEGFSRRTSFLAASTWAATEARSIEFWTEMADGAEARECKRGWWRGDLAECLKEVYRKLRDGGWREEDVREMMMMDGGDEFNRANRSYDCDDPFNWERVESRVSEMSAILLRAGWSRDDVVESLGYRKDSQSSD